MVWKISLEEINIIALLFSIIRNLKFTKLHHFPKKDISENNQRHKQNPFVNLNFNTRKLIMNTKYLITLLSILSSITLFAQDFTKANELKGALSGERVWFDVQHYNLAVEVHPDKQTLEGSNVISYTVLESEKVMQIDLQAPMEIDKITQDGKKLKFKIKEGNHYFIKLKKKQIAGEENQITIKFSGAPKVAENAPWDGGLSWKKDEQGNHFVASSNQGIGASVWWPCKDHPSDEPDKGVDLAITTPSNLMGVGNGRLISEVNNGKTKTWNWKVTNPINNYGVNINVGDFVHFGYTHEGLAGALDA